MRETACLGVAMATTGHTTHLEITRDYWRLQEITRYTGKEYYFNGEITENYTEDY